MTLLAVDALTVAYGATPVLDGVAFAVEPGRILALVGASGSGKSTAALAVLGLLPDTARVGGSVRFAGAPLPIADDRAMGHVRGAAIGFVGQEPMTALDPLMPIGDQVAGAVRQHRRVSRRAALAEAATLLDRVGLPPAAFPLSRYPHQLSGGQRQRVAIAIAIAQSPRLLIADEPTTALDVTTQAAVLDMLRGLVAERGMGLVLVTHDLGVVAGIADRVAVLRHGTIVETGPTDAVLRALRHPGSRELAAAARPLPARHPPDTGAPVLAVEGIVREYAAPGRWRRAAPFRAVDGVSLTLRRGETLGLVGESGSGKTTLLRTILALDAAQAGSVRLDGDPFHAGLPPARLRTLRRRIQPVFQDPHGSFDPRWRVERIVGEPLGLLDDPPSGARRRARVAAMLEAVGLEERDADRFAHEFSGGERQRIGIARALVVRPDILALDEPVSALDVAVRTRILDLLADLTARFGLATIVVTHDLLVVRAIADRIMVMRAGRIVETGATEAVFTEPVDAYTRALIAATPTIDGGLARFGRGSS